MKKSFAILILLAVIAIKANAQDDSRSKLHVGFKAGMNIANVYGSVGENFKSSNRLGFMGGGFVSIPFGAWIGIQPEVLFSQKGTKADGSFEGNTYTLKRTTNTLDIPVLFQFKPFKPVALFFGPQFSYLLSQKDAYTYSDGNTTAIEQQFKNQDYRKANVGIVTGADLYLLGFVLSGRAGWDLQKNTRGGSDDSGPTYKNMWGQVALGFRF